jgi:DNA-binding HxlR family transcriptional regulator
MSDPATYPEQASPGQDCPLRDVLDRFGEKWTVHTMTLLSERSRRFNELRRDLNGISQRMLTRTLRTLERDGLVERTAYPTVPPSVSYGLTELGESLFRSVLVLHEWASEHYDEIRAARAAFDADRARATSQG